MKKLLALLLTLTMLCALFSACAKNETQTTAETTAESTAEAESEPAQAVEPAEAEEPADEVEEQTPAAEAVEGEAPTEAAGPVAEETAYDYTWQAVFPETDPQVVTMLSTEVNIMGALGELGLTQFNQFDYYPKLVELTNTELEVRYLSFMTWSEQYQLFIAAGDYTDLVKGGDYTGGLEQGVEDEVILDFTDCVKEYMPNYYHRIMDYGYLEDVTLNGRFLSISSMYDEYRQNQGLLIRQDWLDELGYEIPETWEDYFTVLKGFKDSYDCDWPVYICQELTMTNFGGNEVPYQAASASDLTMFQDNGTVIASVTTQEQKDYISWLHCCWEAGILNVDFMTTVSNALSPQFNSVVSGGQIGLWPSSIEGLSTLNGMELPEGFAVSAVLGPHEDGDIINHNSEISVTDSTSTIVLVEAEDNLQAVLSWMDFWYSDEGVLLHNYGLEGVDYTLDENGQPQFTEFVTDNSYGLSASNFLRCRTPFGTLTGLDIRTRTAFEYSDQQLAAWDLWTSATGEGERSIPTNATTPTELSNEYTNAASDIATVCNEWLTKFVTGDRDIETEWEDFQALLSSMNIERCVEIRQIALDNYYEQLAG